MASCSVKEISTDILKAHIINEHYPKKLVNIKPTMYSALSVPTLSAAPPIFSRTNSQAKATGSEDSSVFTSAADLSHSDMFLTGPHLVTGPSQVSSPAPQSFILSPLLVISSPPNQLAFPKICSQSSSSSSPSEREMVVDAPVDETEDYEDESEAFVLETDDAPDDSESEETEETIFAQAGYKIITLSHLHTSPSHRLITCIGCLTSVTPKNATSHFRTIHKIKLMPDQIDKIQVILKKHCFESDSKSVDPPEAPCPPIEGLKIHNGFACLICKYCCGTENTMASHFSRNYKNVSGTAKQNYTEASIQAFFEQHPKFFAVNPSLHGLTEDDLFSVYMKKCAPKIEKSRDFNPPQNVNEIPPLLKTMQWHEHLVEYTTDQTKVNELLEIWTLPTSTQGEAWMGKRLRLIIEGYMKDIRKKTLSSPIGIKHLLIVCPRSVLCFYLYSML